MSQAVTANSRLLILGELGYIEIRNYIEIASENSGNHLYLVNKEKMEHIECNDVELTYSPRLIEDIKHRTETAFEQEHTLLTVELA